MKRVILFAPLALALTACASATPTPIPTHTPVPTSTPLPTNTPVPGTPTATPIYNSIASGNAGFERTYETNHYQVYFDTADEPLARAAILASEQVYPVLVRIFEVAPPTKTVMYIFEPGAKADRLFSPSPIFNPAGRNAVFVLTPPLNDSIHLYNPIGILKPDGKEAESLLKWLTAYSVGRRFYWYAYPNIRQPAGARWLEEGLVMYAALDASPFAPLANYGWSEAWEAFNPSRPFILDTPTIDGYTASGKSAPLLYSRAVPTIHLIVKNYGEDGLRRFFGEFNKSGKLQDALVKALGITLGDLQNALNKSLAEARLRSTGGETGFYEAFVGKRRPTPMPTQTPTPTLAPGSFFRNPRLGKLPVDLQASPPATVPIPTTFFTAGDQVCFSTDVVRDVQIAVSVINAQTKLHVIPKVVNPNILKGGSPYVMCMPIVGLMLPDRYQVQIWISDTVVLELPFEVR